MRTQFSDSVTAAIEAGRQVLEVELGSAIRFTNLDVETFKVRHVPSADYPRKQERQLIVTGGFVIVDWAGMESVVDELDAVFSADLHLQKRGLRFHWTLQDDAPCAITIGKEHYIARWQSTVTKKREVRIAAPHLKDRKEYWIVGTTWQNRYQEPISTTARKVESWAPPDRTGAMRPRPTTA